MKYLNSEIELKAKKNETSLVRKHASCGIFQELENTSLQAEKFLDLKSEKG